MPDVHVWQPASADSANPSPAAQQADQRAFFIRLVAPRRRRDRDPPGNPLADLVPGLDPPRAGLPRPLRGAGSPFTGPAGWGTVEVRAANPFGGRFGPPPGPQSVRGRRYVSYRTVGRAKF